MGDKTYVRLKVTGQGAIHGGIECARYIIYVGARHPFGHLESQRGVNVRPSARHRTETDGTSWERYLLLALCLGKG